MRFEDSPTRFRSYQLRSHQLFPKDQYMYKHSYLSLVQPCSLVPSTNSMHMLTPTGSGCCADNRGGVVEGRNFTEWFIDEYMVTNETLLHKNPTTGKPQVRLVLVLVLVLV